MTMHAGPFITRQIERAKDGAAHYRREAKICRDKAANYERLATECDAEAARWSAGTNAETRNRE